jgi:hypothetical protein
LRGQDSNLRPSGYEPDELPGCSTPRGGIVLGGRGGERGGRPAGMIPGLGALVLVSVGWLASSLGMGPSGPGLSFRSIGSASDLRSRSSGLRAARLPLGGSRSLGRLGPVGSARRRASTPGLSTWWSPTALGARPGLEGGFPLRCLQRLSRPGLATRLRGWRHDRSTRGPSAPVLSYWGRPLASLERPRQIGTELSHDVLNPAHVPL